MLQNKRRGASKRPSHSDLKPSRERRQVADHNSGRRERFRDGGEDGIHPQEHRRRRVTDAVDEIRNGHDEESVTGSPGRGAAAPTKCTRQGRSELGPGPPLWRAVGPQVAVNTEAGDSGIANAARSRSSPPLHEANAALIQRLTLMRSSSARSV